MLRAKATACRPKPQTNRHAVTLDGGILPFAPRLTRQPTLEISEIFNNFYKTTNTQSTLNKEPLIHSLSFPTHCKKYNCRLADHCDASPLFPLRLTGLMSIVHHDVNCRGGESRGHW